MKILESWSKVDRFVRYLLRDRYETVDVEDTEMTGFTRHGYDGDEDRAMKNAFKLLESAGW
jgi:hypothetical protein